MIKVLTMAVMLIGICPGRAEEATGETSPEATALVIKCVQLSKPELQEELKRLQEEVISASFTVADVKKSSLRDITFQQVIFMSCGEDLREPFIDLQGVSSIFSANCESRAKVTGEGKAGGVKN